MISAREYKPNHYQWGQPQAHLESVIQDFTKESGHTLDRINVPEKFFEQFLLAGLSPGADRSSYKKSKVDGCVLFKPTPNMSVMIYSAPSEKIEVI